MHHDDGGNGVTRSVDTGIKHNDNSSSNSTSGYHGAALAMLDGAGAAVGDAVDITTFDYNNDDYNNIITHTGIIMPRYEHADDLHIVIKLKSGYNVGIDTRTIKSITVQRTANKDAAAHTRYDDGAAVGKYNHLKNQKKKILLISTGGTIASRIDYRTGAVTPVLSADDLLDAIPELAEMAHIDSDVVISEYSENITPEHWLEIAKRVAMIQGVTATITKTTATAHHYNNKGSMQQKDNPVLPYSGIIIAHGTDTMHYTSAFLSFALAGFPIPIVLVGAQRSSDRASSDAATNMIGAARFIISSSSTPKKQRIGGVYIAMHDGSGDDIVACHTGTRVRKNHTSKRGAFETIGGRPAFLVSSDGVTFQGDGTQDGVTDSTHASANTRTYDPEKISLDKRVALVKYHPGYDPDLLGYVIDSKYRCIILEGTGLGHVGKTLYNQISRAVKNGIFVGMTSQCIDGRICMTVYESGRDLLDAGVVPLYDMIPEVALVKAMWAAGICDTAEGIKEIMLQNVALEVTEPV